jgi:hypothetical protein
MHHFSNLLIYKLRFESLRKENEHRKNAFKAYQAVSDSSESQVFDSDFKETIATVAGELAIAREYIKRLLEAALQAARMSITDMQQNTTPAKTRRPA